VEGMRAMAEQGVDLLLEVGPRRVLSGLARRIVPDIPVRNVEDVASMEVWIDAMSGSGAGAARERSES